jgi:hypothetical protein
MRSSRSFNDGAGDAVPVDGAGDGVCADAIVVAAVNAATLAASVMTWRRRDIGRIAGTRQL